MLKLYTVRLIKMNMTFPKAVSQLDSRQFDVKENNYSRSRVLLKLMWRHSYRYSVLVHQIYLKKFREQSRTNVFLVLHALWYLQVHHIVPPVCRTLKISLLNSSYPEQKPNSPTKTRWKLWRIWRHNTWWNSAKMNKWDERVND